MSFCFIYSVGLENHSVENFPLGVGGSISSSRSINQQSFVWYRIKCCCWGVFLSWFGGFLVDFLLQAVMKMMTSRTFPVSSLIFCYHRLHRYRLTDYSDKDISITQFPQSITL